MASVIGYIDAIINVASLSHVDTAISDPIPFWESNTRLIGNILDYARRVKPKFFIQCSTDEVFGAAPDNYRHHEWDVILPSNPYAASKAAQEALCIAYWRTFDVPVVITNCMNLIGTFQDPEKFLPKTISRIYKNQEMEIHGNENKIGSRMYLDCRNLADAWMFIIKNKLVKKYDDGDHVRLERFNVAGLEEINNLDLANRVAEVMGKELKYKLVDFHATRPGHDLRYALDCSKILSKGWTHPVSFENTIKEIVEWTLKHPEWMC